LSKVSVIITEDTPISLQVSAMEQQIQELICYRDKYEEIAGGIEVEYFIIEGTPQMRIQPFQHLQIHKFSSYY
jgi:hypothetical protein